MTNSPLVDTFGRVHRSLRISVTDRCNIRCVYCMPAETVVFRPRSELLTFEEIRTFCRVAIDLGLDKLRLTGGEPLLRSHLPRLVQMLAELPGLHDLALTTNGIFLAKHAEALRIAGLARLNISLDTLSETQFQKISRRTGLANVLEGIQAAIHAGFQQIRLNAISLRGFTETEIVPLARFAREHRLELRFIEFMPLDADQAWTNDEVLTGAEVRAHLEAEFGPLRPAERLDPHQPATDYVYADGRGAVGFINSVSEPFCGDCDRMRLTADGQIRNCLFSTEEWDARALLRSGAAEDQLRQLIRECIEAKKPGHGIDSPEFLRPQRAMYQIGG